jgi:hypothetical protein
VFNLKLLPEESAMNAATTIIAIPLIFGACLISFYVGKTIEKIDREPREISQQCAYYDMDSGAFTWGPRPVTIDKSLEEGIALPTQKTNKSAAGHK